MFFVWFSLFFLSSPFPSSFLYTHREQWAGLGHGRGRLLAFVVMGLWLALTRGIARMGGSFSLCDDEDAAGPRLHVDGYGALPSLLR